MPILFSLPMRGLGTQDVEALSSYIHRLAIAHGVSAWQLLKQILARYRLGAPETIEATSSIDSSGDMNVYIRPNLATAQLVKILSQATRDESLRCGTFLALSDALDRSAGTFAPRMRWCPACMGEFQASKDGGYFKLVWQLEAVTHCPTHRTRLLNQCGACGSHQSSRRMRRDCTSCGTCGSPLSTRPKSQHSWEPLESWKHVGTDLVGLVASIAENPRLAYPADGVRNVLSAIFDRAWANGEEEKLWELVPKNECIGIVEGHQAVSLTTARRIAFRLGMRLPDLLAGTVDATTGMLDPTWTATLPSEMRPKKRRRSHDKHWALGEIQRVLALHKNKPPPPLEQVAREIGISVGYIHYNFPVQAKQIIKRHKAQCEEERVHKRLRALASAVSFFYSERYAHEVKSRKNALRVLRASTGLPKNLLREGIAEAIEIMVASKRMPADT